MKIVLLCSIVFCAITLPALGELTDADLDKIRLIVNDSEKRVKEGVKSEIATTNDRIDKLDDRLRAIETDVAQIHGKIEGMEKQISLATNFIYGLIALIVVAVGIPQIIIAWRSGKNNTHDNKNDAHTPEIKVTTETLAQ